MSVPCMTASEETIAQAADALRAGQLVAFPTETVYGLGADATNDEAVARIFEAKGRPRFNPLIVHVSDMQEAERHARFTPEAEKLAAAFWPGGVTLVLPRRAETDLSLLVSAGLDTVAIRVPAHSIAQRLIEATGRPLAAPSANASGKVSPTRAGHVVESLGHSSLLAMVLDGGPCEMGLESTVVGFPDGGTPTLLRPGAVARGDIEKVLGAPIAEAAPQSDKAGRSSPGQLASHYAPNAPIRLDVREKEDDEILLGFGPDAPSLGATLNLSVKGDLTEAAANLFAMLRALDEQAQGRRLAVMPIPHEGLGEAINDRLSRAAADRS